MKIFAATPAFGGQVCTSFMQSVLALAFSGELFGWQAVSESFIPRARDTLLSVFMDSGAPYVLMVDADIGFTAEQVCSMLEFDVDFVAGAAPMKGYPIELCYVPETPEPPSQRFVRALRVGGGFILLKRAAVGKMMAAHPELRYDRSDLERKCIFPDLQTSVALFHPILGTEGYMSEDLSFVKRWRDLGGTVWVDTQCKLSHTGPHTFQW